MILFIISPTLLQDFGIFSVVDSLIADSSSFTLFAGPYHVFVQAGTIYSFDCSIERLFLSYWSGLCSLTPLKALCTLSAKDLGGVILDKAFDWYNHNLWKRCYFSITFFWQSPHL